MDLKSLFLSGTSVFNIILGMVTLNAVATIIGIGVGIVAMGYNATKWYFMIKDRKTK